MELILFMAYLNLLRGTRCAGHQVMRIVTGSMQIADLSFCASLRKYQLILIKILN